MQLQRRKRSGRRDPKRKDRRLVPFSRDVLFVPAAFNADESERQLSLRFSSGDYSKVGSTFDIDSLTANDNAPPEHENQDETIFNNNQKRKSSPILISHRPSKQCARSPARRPDPPCKHSSTDLVDLTLDSMVVRGSRSPYASLPERKGYKSSSYQLSFPMAFRSEPISKKQFVGTEVGTSEQVPTVSPFLERSPSDDFAKRCRPDPEPGNLLRFQFDVPSKRRQDISPSPTMNHPNLPIDPPTGTTTHCDRASRPDPIPNGCFKDSLDPPMQQDSSSSLDDESVKSCSVPKRYSLANDAVDLSCLEPMTLCSDHSVSAEDSVIDLSIDDDDKGGECPVNNIDDRARGEDSPKLVTPPQASFPPHEVFRVTKLADIPKRYEGNDDITSYPFVYEFERRQQPSSSKLSLSARWKKCTHLYIVFQGTQQVGCSKHLEHHHYQEDITLLFDELRKLFSGGGPVPEVICIGPTGSYDNERMYIRTFGLDECIIPVQLLMDTLAKTKSMATDKT